MKKLDMIRWALFISFNVEITISILIKEDLLFLSIGIASLIACVIIVFGFKDKQPNYTGVKQE